MSDRDRFGYLKENKVTGIGVILGVIGGYLYWKFVGCVSGTCAITSNPIMSSIYGGLMGGLLFSMFKKEDKSPSKPNLEK